MDSDALVKEGSIPGAHPGRCRAVGMPAQTGPSRMHRLLDAPGVGRSVLGNAVYRSLMPAQPDEHAIFIIASGKWFRGIGFCTRRDFGAAAQVRRHRHLHLSAVSFSSLQHRGSGPPRLAMGYPSSSLTHIQRGLSLKLVISGQQDGPANPRQDFRQLRPGILAAQPLSGRGAAGNHRAGSDLGDRLENPQDRGHPVSALAHRSGNGVCVARHAGSSLNDERQALERHPQIFSVGDVDRFRRVLPAGRAVHHAGADLVPRHPVRVALGVVPVRSVRLPVLDFHRRLGVLLGRGMFCGWMCPYGSLAELVYHVAGKLGLKRYQRHLLPQNWHDRLKWIKYGIFAILLAVSFYSIGLAEKLAEIEPFKTTFLVGVWNRSWPFVTFWTVLIVASAFFERPFCKYLCPLGAALAVPSTFRWWGLKRKKECGPCAACQVGCGSQAIDDSGRIDQRECLLCLDCQVLYYDDHACPPLAQERKRRTKAGEPLTAIGSDGYFIPIVPAVAAPAAATRQSLPASSGRSSSITRSPGAARYSSSRFCCRQPRSRWPYW